MGISSEARGWRGVARCRDEFAALLWSTSTLGPAWDPSLKTQRSGSAAFVKRFGRSPPSRASTSTCRSARCVGLLGPNGAGKSTTMKALTAQVIADEGELEVLGFRLPDDSKQARAEMGVVPQLDNLDSP